MTAGADQRARLAAGATAPGQTRDAPLVAPDDRPAGRRLWRPARPAASTDRFPAAAGRPPGPHRSTLAWVGVYVAAQAAFLLLLRVLSPRFFYLDDQQAQYLPMFAWMGRNLSGGRPPLLAPEQGAAGNLVADAQYGAYDPVHWLISALVSTAGNLNDAAWVLGGVPVFVLGLGIVTLLRSYRCAPALAVAAALGTASSGFFLWFGTAWWPLMWSTSFLPWLWYGLATRRWLGVPVTGVAAYLLASAGYPYNLLFAGVTVAAQLGERWVAGGLPALRAPETVARCVAGLGGVVAALPGLLSVAQMLPFTTREFPQTAAGNPAMFVPNLVDVVLGSSTLTPNVSDFWFGNLMWAPVAATVAFAVPAAALVAWRQVVSRPGVATAAVLVVTAVLATQLPTYVGPFRQPWRYLADYQLYLPILVVLGLTYGAVLTRARLVAAAGLAGLQFLLAVARSPLQAGWHLLALVVAGLALASVVAHRDPARAGMRRAGTVGLLLTVLAAAVLSERAATALDNRFQAINGFPLRDEPARDLYPRDRWPSTVAEFREHALRGADPDPDSDPAPDPDAPVAPAAPLDGIDPTVLTFSGLSDPKGLSDPQGGWGTGVLGGNANLFADVQPGFGYVAVGHKAWAERTCGGRYGQRSATSECVGRMLEPVPGTDRPYVDVLASDRVLLAEDTPGPLVAYFDSAWDELGPVGAYTAYARRAATPGRVTATRGEVSEVVALSEPGRPAYGGQPLGSYRVSTGPAGGELLLRVPFWPGLEATVAGEPVEVGDVDGTLTVVPLPGGLAGAPVEVTFSPVGEPLLVPALALGLVLVGGATASAAGRRRAAQDASD